MPLLHPTREPDAPQDDARFLPFSAAQRCLFAAAGASPAAIEIDLSRRICAAALQRAAEAAFSRYPYLNAVLSEGEDGVLLRAATPSVRPARAADPRAAVEVSYEKKRIRIRFLRALHDARAVKPFAELLLARYFDPLPARLPSASSASRPRSERTPLKRSAPRARSFPFRKSRSAFPRRERSAASTYRSTERNSAMRSGRTARRPSCSPRSYGAGRSQSAPSCTKRQSASD